MNLPEYAPAAMAAIACLVSILVCYARTRRTEQRCARLSADLSAFAEASVRVADTLDALLRGQVVPGEGHPSSRRYLLAQAQRGMAEGESLEAVAQRLHLSHDEARLLGFVALNQTRNGRRPGNRRWAA